MRSREENAKRLLDARNLIKKVESLLLEKKPLVALQHCLDAASLLLDKETNVYYNTREELRSVVSWFEAFLSSGVFNAADQDKCCRTLSDIYIFWASWQGFGYAPPNAIHHYQSAINTVKGLRLNQLKIITN